MDKKILKAIEEGLPAQTAGALKKRIEDIELIEYRYEQALENISELEDKVRELGDKEKLDEDLKARAVKLDEREDNVTKREFKIELQDEKISNLTVRIEEIKEMYRVPFANRVLRENVLTNESGRHDSNGNSECINESKDTTIEEG